MYQMKGLSKLSRIIKLLLVAVILITSNSAHAKEKLHVIEGKTCYLENAVVVDSYDGQQFIQLVRVGIVFWNATVGRTILKHERPTLVSFLNKKRVSVTTASVGDLDTNQLGTTEPHYDEDFVPKCLKGATIKIDPNISIEQKLHVIIHELGHAIGLDHSSDPYSLMYHKVSKRSQIKLATDTKQELKRLYGEKQ